ncbi:hypothetical protein V6N11_083865 [Hibiscus sabdariffa]|uniref:Reverse transcriptase zinc-binding domain-containing protein n=1 Tax=Hibiscus sabdariffa TaxID=183260 RepID=A0ABR2QDB1_9ROSI
MDGGKVMEELYWYEVYRISTHCVKGNQRLQGVSARCTVLVPTSTMVRDMVTDSRDWDWDWARLEAVLPAIVLDHVATVPPPRLSFGLDNPGWRWTDNRRFTTHSTYMFLMDINDRPIDGIWKKIWSLPVPQCVRTFMWLTLHQRHLTNVERVRRHLASSDMCSICNLAVEDLDHVLRYCTRTRSHWRQAVPPELLSVFMNSPFDSLVRHNLLNEKVGGSPEIQWNCRFAVYCWLLWKERCTTIFDPMAIVHDNLLVHGSRLAMEYTTTFTTIPRQLSPVTGHDSFWSRPPRGWVKGNIDASCSVLAAELWVVHDMLAQAWRLNFRQVDWKLVIRHVSRDRNHLTDKIAALRRSASKNGELLLNPPASLVTRVEDDISHSSVGLASSGCV